MDSPTRQLLLPVKDSFQEKNNLNELKDFINEEGFQLLLRVITEDDPIKAVAIRSLIQRVINAPAEGRRYNQAYWLCGAPATSKSFIVRILQYFTNNSYVELSRTQNQFTAIAFKDVKLIVVSDINRLSAEMIDMLRKILGRDIMYAEEKHKTGTIVVKPFAQVIFTSNEGPEKFPEIFTKPGFKDKISVLHFKRSIPENLMVSDMNPILEMYASQFFIWGSFTPQFFLDQQVRAKTIMNYYLKATTPSVSYYNEYIEERLVVAKDNCPPVKVTSSEFKNDFEDWVAENSLMEELTSNTVSKRFMISNIINTIQLDYGIDIEQKRIRVSDGRKFFIIGVGLASQNKDNESAKPIKREVNSVFDFKEVDPFTAVEYISRPSIDKKSFTETSRKIIEYRTKRESASLENGYT